MGRNRNDSGGSFSHAQMRASFTDMYRKRIGNQDVKKTVKVSKETMKKHDMKINASSIYRDIFIMIGVLLLIFCSLYYVFNVILVELDDLLPTVTAKTEV